MYSEKPMDDQNTTQTNPGTHKEAAEVQQDAANPEADQQDALQMIELEKSVKTLHMGIAAKQKELRGMKETIQDTLENDQTYAEHTEKVNEAKRIQKATADQLMSVGSIVSLKSDMSELNADLRELRQLLSKRLMEYYEATDQPQITMEDGETYVIQTTARLVKQKS